MEGRLSKVIPVFYTPKQVAADNISNSPSAGKPVLVVESWLTAGFPIEIKEPEPVTVEDLCRVHDPDHVKAVLACESPNGFDNCLPSVAASLPWTNGSFLSAARHLVKTGERVAVSPTSGFHHAGYGRVEGFCTFNGLMVTVAALRADGFKGKIGILDLDEHWGNGTDSISRLLGFDDILHYSFGAEDLNRGDGDKWLASLNMIVRMFHDCSIVLYQAGADPHEHDPYARGVLSTQQLYQRDRIVFATLRDSQNPVVWNLAGGYQRPVRKVLDIHDNTMRACVEFFGT